MTVRDDAFEAWMQRARDADVLDVAINRCAAALTGRGRERAGPCPRCGGDDRFSVNTVKQVFNCRGADGGDVIRMVMHCHAVSFAAGCEIINGEPPPARGTQLTPEEKSRAAEQLRASKARALRRDADENAYRQRERETVAGIWENAHPLPGSSAEDYLTLRGLTFPSTQPGRADRIRCVEDMPYFVSQGKGKPPLVVHRGPAMVMPIVDAGRVFRGLHFTYLDLTTPKGKLVLEHAGELLDAKKSRGSKNGNHVELIGSTEPSRLVMGEGAEKVIAVWRALDMCGRDLSDWAFWSACDLGNFAGKAIDKIPHPTLKHEKSKRPVAVPGVVPDCFAAGIAIPDSVTDLILLADTTSDAFTTELAMHRAAARYAAPGRTVRVAWAFDDDDFDDLFRRAENDGDRQQAAEAICVRIEAAAAPVMGSELRGYVEAPARASGSEQQRAGEVSPGATGGEAAPNVLAFPRTKRPPSADSSFSPSSSPPPSTTEESGATLANEDGEPGRDNQDPPLDGEDGDEGPPPDDISDDTFRACAELDHSDTDNATRLIAYLGRDLMVRQEDDVPAGQWLAWTGTHWDLAGGEALAHLLAQRVGDLIKIEARYMDFTEKEARAVMAADIAAKNLKGLDPDTADADQLAIIQELEATVLKGQKARNALASRKTNRRKWGVGTKNMARISAMLKCAAPRLRRHPDDFNAEQLKVATLTHTLSFVTVNDPDNPDPDGERPWIDPETKRARYRLVARKGHERGDLLTAVIPFVYKPGAPCVDFNAFLDLFQPEPNKRRTIQQYTGMGLTAQPVQLIMFHTGTGGNGKSVFLEVMTRVLGDGLAGGIPSETLSGQTQNNPSAPTPDIARCYGKRFLRVAEMPKGEPLKNNTIKKLTGGERWPVRTMYKGYFEFKPTAKPHMSGNDVPPFEGADGGLRRRLIFMPWSVTLPVEKHRDFEDVVSEIVAGGSGILNWLIEGALDFLNKGILISEDVAQETADQFAEMDPCGQFVDAHVRADPDGPGVTARAMYDAYKLWCDANGRAHMFETRFGRTMKTKLKRDDKGRVRVYVGVTLHDLPEKKASHRDDDEPPPHPGPDRDAGF